MIFVDATTLIVLGKIGEFDLLNCFDDDVTVLPQVRREVTTEPAKTNLEEFVESEGVSVEVSIADEYVERAKDVLDEDDVSGDVAIVAGVLSQGNEVAVVSDDKRVRTVSRGFGVTMSGTVGVVVRAVSEELSREEGKDLIKRIDSHGLHMTGELREKAYELIEEVE